MKKYEMSHIRNVALVGGSGSGKTTLAEHILFAAKKTTRIGRVEDGNTAMDYSQEEIDKGISMSLAIANFEWKHAKVNLLDVPGTADFAADQLAASQSVETLLFVTNAAATSFEVGLEQTIELLAESDNARAVIVNGMDREGADFNKALDLIRENSDYNPVPILLPIGSEEKFEGVVDIIKGKAFIKGQAVDIPANMAELVENSRVALMEAVAESDDALLEKYFEEGKLSDAELAGGIKTAITKGTLIPAFAVSAGEDIAISELINAIVDYLPSPADKNKVKILSGTTEKEFICNEDGELLAFSFKLLSDPNLGEIAYVRVFSGKLIQALDVYIPEKETKDRIGTVAFFNGKHRGDAEEICAGDIGGIVKVKAIRSFNSIVKPGSDMRKKPVTLPSPVFWQAIKAVYQKDEDKIGAGLTKLLDEDPTLNLTMNVEAGEYVVSGIGDQQIQLIVKKLLSRFKIEASLHAPSVNYRETMKGATVDVSYKHKKQSGGRGQYAEVYFRVTPRERGTGFEFKNSVVGGTIPSGYIPAIEKGLKEIMSKGIVCGNPIVDVEVDVYFGSYHDVDSSEMAFKIATWQAMKKAFAEGSPILLEPIHNIQIIIPNEYMGDVMGDISTRRGRISGMEQEGRKQILNATIPLSELYGYYPALKSLTQGRGKFTQDFSHYEKVPDEITQKVVAAYESDDE
ncbi:MAG: elongation factor G [Candidatus Cloacimonetes bacterium]|nr:elongation factor G [Candidatus Cloacimonadota bacterium]